MVTAYFITASLLFVWCYRQTRLAAKAIRRKRRRMQDQWS